MTMRSIGIWLSSFSLPLFQLTLWIVSAGHMANWRRWKSEFWAPLHLEDNDRLIVLSDCKGYAASHAFSLFVLSEKDEWLAGKKRSYTGFEEELLLDNRKA
jgi:hypothetical protein